MNLLPKPQNKAKFVSFEGIADAEMTTKQGGWKITKETYDYLLDQIKQYEHSFSR